MFRRVLPSRCVSYRTPVPPPSRRKVCPNVGRRMLYGAEAVYMSTILEDCVNELSILGFIMPGTYEFRTDASEMVADEIKDIIDNQTKLENHYEDVRGKLTSVKGGLPSQTLDIRRDMASAAADLRSNVHVFARSMKQSPLTSDNLVKVQEDRNFLERVAQSTYQELLKHGTYESLSTAVATEQSQKQDLQNVIFKEEGSRKRIRTLKRQIEEVKREKETELQSRNEMIAHLKDQLQEMKAKTNMEGKYIKKCADVAVSQTMKKCNLSEKELRDEIDSLREQIDQEMRVNAETESWLRTHQTELEQKVEFWMEKYEKDVEKLQHELDVLKASKAKDLQKLQELTQTYKEYEEVVVDDRIEKEKQRRKAELEKMELNSSIKIQAWWRTMMVRKQIGPYGKKKKGKKGKGKKSGKKGKKGKKR